MNILQESQPTNATTEHSERTSYRPTELPGLLSLSQSMCYKLLHAGQIRSIRVGRRFVIPADAVTDFLTNGPRAASATVKGG